MEDTSNPFIAQTSQEQVTDAITDLDSKRDSMNYNDYIERRTRLAEQKLQNTPREKLPDGVQDFMSVDADGNPRDMSEAEPGSETQISNEDKFVVDRLQEEFGENREQRMYELTENVSRIFGGSEKAAKFISENIADPTTRFMLAKEFDQLTGTPAQDCGSAEKAVSTAEKSLRREFGDNFDATLSLARQNAVKIFGSIERFDMVATANGWTRDPDKQAQIVKMLARIRKK